MAIELRAMQGGNTESVRILNRTEWHEVDFEDRNGLHLFDSVLEVYTDAFRRKRRSRRSIGGILILYRASHITVHSLFQYCLMVFIRPNEAQCM